MSPPGPLPHRYGSPCSPSSRHPKPPVSLAGASLQKRQPVPATGLAQFVERSIDRHLARSPGDADRCSKRIDRLAIRDPLPLTSSPKRLKRTGHPLDSTHRQAIRYGHSRFLPRKPTHSLRVEILTKCSSKSSVFSEFTGERWVEGMSAGSVLAGFLRARLTPWTETCRLRRELPAELRESNWCSAARRYEERFGGHLHR